MRVISGTAKGRTLKAVPGTTTRPTTDKVKEALFSIIGPYFDGGLALDLFAGTGGLGIEAISRGVDKAVFIDVERRSIEVIRQNLEAAGLAEQAEVYRNDAFRALHVLARRGLRFDLVFVDPPYRLNIIEKLLQTMVDHCLLNEHAVIAVEQDSSFPGVALGTFVRRRRAEYGDTVIEIYDYAVNADDCGDETNGGQIDARDGGSMSGQL